MHSLYKESDNICKNAFNVSFYQQAALDEEISVKTQSEEDNITMYVVEKDIQKFRSFKSSGSDKLKTKLLNMILEKLNKRREDYSIFIMC